MKNLTIVTLVLLASGVAGIAEAQQPLAAPALRRAEAQCRRGRGSASSCRLAGAHHLSQPGAEAGQRGIQFLRWACERSDGEACGLLSAAFFNGRRDQHIAEDHEEAGRIALRACEELHYMPSCGMAERLGLAVTTISVEQLSDWVFSFRGDLSRERLEQRCSELGGALEDGRRPDGTLWRTCTIERPMESSTAGTITVRLLARGRATTEISVTAEVHARGMSGTPEGRALSVRVREGIVARARQMYGLEPDPGSPDWEARYLPAQPNGVRARAGTSPSGGSVALMFDPAAYRATPEE